MHIIPKEAGEGLGCFTPNENNGITLAKNKNSHRSVPLSQYPVRTVELVERERGGDMGDRLTDIHTHREGERGRQTDRQTETERETAEMTAEKHKNVHSSNCRPSP